jgi:hypothetical protein
MVYNGYFIPKNGNVVKPIINHPQKYHRQMDRKNHLQVVGFFLDGDTMEILWEYLDHGDMMGIYSG